MENNNSINYKAIDPRDIKVMEGFNQRIDFGDIDELAAQIKEQGLLEAISVVPYVEDGREKYLLVNGERRYRAIMKLIEDGDDPGVVKANILPPNLTDEQLLAQQYMRNEGKRFNDVELGMLCQKLKGLGYNNSQIAKMLGKNPGVITYALQSLEYDPRIIEMMKNGEIGGTEVRRVYTAARKKYGKDWEAKGNEEILAKREKANADNDTDKPAKVSIKRDGGLEEGDLYGDVKDTKTFFNGIRTLLNYITHYEKTTGLELAIDINQMYKDIKDNPTLTLRDLFEKAVAEAKKEAEAV